MSGFIIFNNNYNYEGGILNDLPHGKGIFYYNNGDKYIGDCKVGKPDGFGKYYYHNGDFYKGFFSNGKMNGIGTYETNKCIYKGSWREDKKSGNFIKTNKQKNNTYLQLWVDNIKTENKIIQYIQPAALETYKYNPAYQNKHQTKHQTKCQNKYQTKYQTKYKNKSNTEKKCVACFDKSMNATNTTCGHISMCYECLSKCDKCPICRVNISQIIKLYVS
jgi:hypothetical protein